MKPNQTMKARDGLEVALFPLEYMYITQGEMMGPSHYNVYNMDFIGWGPNGRVEHCPLYAPCTLKVVDLWDYNNSHTVTFESIDKVHFADGSIDYLTIAFTHDNNPPYHTIGEVINQGNLIYHTGTYGEAYGDHVHMTAGKGKYVRYVERTGGHYDLLNRYHLYDTLYINDTIIEEDYNYDWKEFIGPFPPTTRKRNKFPWVLYGRKINERRSL